MIWIAAVVLLTFLLTLLLSRLLRRYEAYLERLCAQWKGTYKQKYDHLEQILKGKGAYQFQGLYRERAFEIEYSYRWGAFLDEQIRDTPKESLRIRFPVIQKFWLRMIRSGPEKHSGEDVLFKTPAGSIYLIHSNQMEAASEFLKMENAQNQFPVIFDRLEIYQGAGEIEILFPARRRFSENDFTAAITSLFALLSAYEGMSKLVLAVFVHGILNKCPYCRDEFRSGHEQIVHCGQCGARLHQSCWKENGECTTWGCQTRIALRT